jgi:hypothetical protein
MRREALPYQFFHACQVESDTTGPRFGSCLFHDPSLFFRRMSEILTADLLALDTDGLKSRLSKLRRYL